MKNQVHIFRGTSRGFCEVIGTTYLAKAAVVTVLILNGPKSTTSWERQTHVNENSGYMWHDWGSIPAWHETSWLPLSGKVQLLSFGARGPKKQSVWKFPFQSLTFLCKLAKAKWKVRMVLNPCYSKHHCLCHFSWSAFGTDFPLPGIALPWAAKINLCCSRWEAEQNELSSSLHSRMKCIAEVLFHCTFSPCSKNDLMLDPEKHI